MALQIPDWFDKTPEEVASDSRLQGHYLNARLGDDGFVADVASQIPFACAYVTPKLRTTLKGQSFPLSLVQLETAFPQESQAEHIERRDEMIALASKAVTERVIYDLYRMLPGADNQGIAEGCRRAADELLSSLLSNLTEASDALLSKGKANLNSYGSLSMARADPLPYPFTSFDFEDC